MESIILFKTLVTFEYNFMMQRCLFPQVQMYFFNTDLYRNFSEASERANGVAAVAVFLKVAVIHDMSSNA